MIGGDIQMNEQRENIIRNAVSGTLRRQQSTIYDTYSVLNGGAGLAMGETVTLFTIPQGGAKNELYTNLTRGGQIVNEMLDIKAIEIEMFSLGLVPMLQAEMNSFLYSLVFKLIVNNKEVLKQPASRYPAGSGAYGAEGLAVGNGLPSAKNIQVVASEKITKVDSFTVELYCGNAIANPAVDVQLRVYLDGDIYDVVN